MSFNIPAYLTPPGNGVHTVHTGGEKKEKLHQLYYQSSKPDVVKKSWEKEVEKILSSKLPLLLGSPSDCGAGILRGSNWGPLAIREKIAHLKNKFIDLGDIRVIPHLLHDKDLNAQTMKQCRLALYQDENINLPVSPLSQLEAAVDWIFKHKKDAHLMTLGGDHSMSYATTKSWLSHQDTKSVAIIHFDAHTDLLSQRLGIDYCFGTWAYHTLKLLPNPAQMVQIGIRSSGKDKAHWENTLGLKQWWSQEVLQQGADQIASKIKKHLESLKIKNLYVSVDIDCLDQEYASATGTPETDGMRPHEVVSIIRHLAQDFHLQSADLVEVAPSIDNKSKNLEPQTTLESARVIIEAIFDQWK
jgi:agmatinase